MSAILPQGEIKARRPDCLAAQRGFELLNPETRGKRRGDWRLIFIAERSGLLRRRERHCRRAEIRADWPYSDPAPLAMVPLRGFGGDGAWCRCNRKGSANVAQQNSQKDRGCARQEPRETACKAWDHSLGFDPQRDQAGGRPRPAQTAQGDNDRHHYEGDGLAAALGPRLLCGCGAQEARLDTDIGEGRGRTRLSCACQPADQIEAEDLRTTGRLAMASMDSRAIEGAIDPIRSLGLDDLRREWREACAAFILSQKHEGWTVLPTLYDDGGFSGGTMERPALKRLIADIEAGQIDVVVVYKGRPADPRARRFCQARRRL